MSWMPLPGLLSIFLSSHELAHLDGNSYGYRDIDGSKVQKALREKCGEEGYVIRLCINLPDGNLYATKYKGTRIGFVLKDNTVKKEELCARAKAFADSLSYPSGVNICTIGTPSKAKSANGNESEPILHSGMHNINKFNTNNVSRTTESDQSSQTTMVVQGKLFYNALGPDEACLNELMFCKLFYSSFLCLTHKTTEVKTNANQDSSYLMILHETQRQLRRIYGSGKSGESPVAVVPAPGGSDEGYWVNSECGPCQIDGLIP
ncbi:hypothetical protein L1987_30065 [Smallanthus sonchifolius]|uniref:Uncharacterized protein n=1 Tax=Smallanthus sonchifolius TaxID=185202 RepID=A0ACB9I329_9ASTR|nr:hypothetical protein L1987_30065 [Smallanthus sonchifolius]